MAFNDNQKDWQVKCRVVRKRTAHLYNTREWADCTFRFDPDKSNPGPSSSNCVKAHKLILSMSSPVFAAQFYGSVADEDTILVEDIDRRIFSKVMRYIYTDDIKVDCTETALDVYYAAKKYLLEHLQEFCIDFVLDTINPHNVCQIYEFACFHDEQAVKERCLKVFKKQTLKVLKSENFLKAKVDTLKAILSLDQLTINDELDLFDALVKYADSEMENSNLAEKMANTLCSLFEKHSTKTARRNQTTIDSDSNASSDEAEDEEIQTPATRSVVTKPAPTDNSNDKAECVRRLLRPCVSQVRFLTLSPRRFAENKRLSALLTGEEIMAVALNIASKQAAVTMPEGFSTCLAPRALLSASAAAVIKFTLSDAAQSKKYVSDVACAHNIPWAVAVQAQEKRTADCDKKVYVRVSVQCLLDKARSWSVPASAAVRLTWASDDGRPEASAKNIHFTFTNAQSEASISYEFRNHCITFEITIEPKRPDKIPHPLSAYELWQKSQKERIRRENPLYTEAQVTQALENGSAVWWMLADKTKWEEKEEQEMKRYREEKRKRKRENSQLLRIIQKNELR